MVCFNTKRGRWGCYGNKKGPNESLARSSMNVFKWVCVCVSMVTVNHSLNGKSFNCWFVFYVFFSLKWSFRKECGIVGKLCDWFYFIDLLICGLYSVCLCFQSAHISWWFIFCICCESLGKFWETVKSSDYFCNLEILYIFCKQVYFWNIYEVFKSKNYF